MLLLLLLLLLPLPLLPLAHSHNHRVGLSDSAKRQPPAPVAGRRPAESELGRPAPIRATTAPAWAGSSIISLSRFSSRRRQPRIGSNSCCCLAGLFQNLLICAQLSQKLSKNFSSPPAAATAFPATISATTNTCIRHLLALLQLLQLPLLLLFLLLSMPSSPSNQIAKVLNTLRTVQSNLLANSPASLLAGRPACACLSVSGGYSFFRFRLEKPLCNKRRRRPESRCRRLPRQIFGFLCALLCQWCVRLPSASARRRRCRPLLVYDGHSCAGSCAQSQ